MRSAESEPSRVAPWVCVDMLAGMEPLNHWIQAGRWPWTRVAMAELASRLPVDDGVLDGWLGEVVAKREEVAFRNLVFAGLGAGRPLCAKHLEEGTALFQDTDQLHRTAVRFTGNVGSALIAAVDTGRLEPDREAVAVAVAAMWCRERDEGQRIPGLMAAARRLGRRRRKSPATALALAIVCQVTEDPGLRSLMEGVSLPWVSGCELEFWRVAETGLWDCVPEEAGSVALSGYTVRRAVPRVGRNEPCPCGSGRKYKHCCLSKDQERLRQSSPVPGVTLEEWREQPELGLTWRRLREMTSYELVRLDPRKVPPGLHDHLMDSLLSYHEYEGAVRCLEVTEPEDDGGWFYWTWTLEDVARVGNREWVNRLLALRPGLDTRELGVSVRLLLAGDEGRGQLDLVEEEALRVLRGEKSSEALVNFACGLLDGRTPALGVLVARGVLPLAPGLDGDTLLTQMLEVRDRLGLAVEEPMEEVFYGLIDKNETAAEQDSEELAESRRALELKGGEVRRLKDQLAALQRDLQARETRTRELEAVSGSPTSEVHGADRLDDAEITELRSKLRGLRERLKERHAERNELRRELMLAREQLAEAQSRRSAPTPVVPGPTVAESLFAEAEDLGQQPVRWPQWPHKFRQELARLPLHVARAVLILVGRLAAGEPGAFAGIKRLRLTPDVYRQRVGADYRLLFRMNSEDLEVVELVNRKDLERVVKERF